MDSETADSLSPTPYAPLPGSEPDLHATAAWLSFFLQSNDTFYPTGSYAHSFGLEGLVQAGLVADRASLREFIFASVLPSLRHNDLPIAAQAWRAFAKGDWERIGELSVLASALKTAKEARVCAENIGRQRAELCASLHESELARTYLRRVHSQSWPTSPAISAALEGRIFQAPIDAVLVSIYYSAIAGILAAAMKLLRIGQNGAQTLLTEAMSHASSTISAAIAIPFEDVGWFNPWLDIAAARHETAEARLFIS